MQEIASSLQNVPRYIFSLKNHMAYLFWAILLPDRVRCILDYEDGDSSAGRPGIIGYSAPGRTEHGPDPREGYFDMLENISKTGAEADLQHHDPFFYICKHYANRIAPVENWGDKTEMLRNAIVLDIARQICSNLRSGFEKSYKKVRFLD